MLRIEWRQVAASFVLLGCAAVITATYSLVAVALSRDFAVSRMTLMLPMTIVSGVSALISPLFGRIMDRGKLRPLMLLGAVALALGYAALSVVTSFPMVMLVFGLLMAPANVLIGPVAASVLLSRWFTQGRGRALGIAMAGISIGGFAFSPLLQFLLDLEGWRMAFRLLGLIIAVCAIPAALLVAERPASPGSVKANAAPTAFPSAAPATAGEILAHPAFWLLGLIIAVVMAGLTGVITNLAPLVLDQGLTPAFAAAMISVFTGCSFTAKLLFAAIADRLGPQRMIYVILLGFAAGAACLACAGFGMMPILFGVGLVGLFGGLTVPLQSLLVPRLFGAQVVGQVMGMLSVVTLIALLATPPLLGFVFDRTGSYRGVFVAFVILACGLMLVVPRLALTAGEKAR